MLAETCISPNYLWNNALVLSVFLLGTEKDTDVYFGQAIKL
jgi:hypothetical protein